MKYFMFSCMVFPFLKKKKSIPKLDLDLEKNTYVLSWGVSSDVQLYY